MPGVFGGIHQMSPTTLGSQAFSTPRTVRAALGFLNPPRAGVAHRSFFLFDPVVGKIRSSNVSASYTWMNGSAGSQAIRKSVLPSSER
jgi:hypothetical protein